MSPTATLVTAEPTSLTQPAFSWPRMYGSGVPIAASHWPSMMCRSVRHTPAPPIFTITSSGLRDRRLGDLVDDRRGMELMQSYCFHGAVPSGQKLEVKGFRCGGLGASGEISAALLRKAAENFPSAPRTLEG